MVNPYTVTFADPVKGSLDVERELSTLATARENRAEMALRQQQAGLDLAEFQANAPAREAARQQVLLNLAEFRANAPLREAERQKKLGDYQYADQIAREGAAIAPAAASPAGVARGTGARLPGTAGFIAGFESFSPTPYEDMTVRGGQRVSAGLRGGYGSDTVTLADGRVVPVTPGMTISEADAQRDLFRRIETEFQPRAVQAVGPTVWSSLPPQAHDALVSIAYNYGDVKRAEGVAEAAKSGDLERLASAIEARAGDNGGINRQRRLAEAAHVRSAITTQAAPQAPATPAGLMTFAPGLSPAARQAQPAQPPSMLAAPNAGLPAGFSPAGVPIAMYAAPEDERLVGMFPGTEPIPAGPIGPRPAAPPTLPPPPAFRVTTPEGIEQAPVATDLAGLGLAPVGRAPVGRAPAAPAPAPIAGGGGGAAQPVNLGLGLQYSEPAQRLQQQIARERTLLQQELASIGRLPVGSEQRAEANRIRRALAALEDKEADVQADLAAAGILSGQPGLANQLLARNGVVVQPKVANGRFTGYDLIQNGSLVQSNMSPEKLAETVRTSYNADARKQMQERAKAQYETALEVFKERAKQLGVATTEIAKIEAQARTQGYSRVTPIQGDNAIVLSNAAGDTILYRIVNVPGSKDKKEIEVIQGRANVPIQ